MPIIARAHDLAECERLVRAGATAAVPEIVEGSLQLAPSAWAAFTSAPR